MPKPRTGWRSWFGGASSSTSGSAPATADDTYRLPESAPTSMTLQEAPWTFGRASENSASSSGLNRLIQPENEPVDDTGWDEGPAMTAGALIGVAAFLVACGVHPDDFGEAWAIVRQQQHHAEHPSEMAPLARHIFQYARERQLERERERAGLVGRHTGPIAAQ
jgi:hypothetical protein